MKIDEKKLLEELNKLWINKQCPICNNTSWGIDSRVVTPLNVGKNNSILIGGPIAPLVPVTCDKCGYTIFVNALKLGVLEFDEEKENGK